MPKEFDRAQEAIKIARVLSSQSVCRGRRGQGLSDIRAIPGETKVTMTNIGVLRHDGKWQFFYFFLIQIIAYLNVVCCLNKSRILISHSELEFLYGFRRFAYIYNKSRLRVGHL